jgi:hypothetical protein
VVLLFDIDQTIVEVDPNNGRDERGYEKKIVRPAFPILIDTLRQVLGQRLEVGLLTLVPSGRVWPNGEMPPFLESAGDSVKPEFLMSARDVIAGDTEFRDLDLSEDIEGKSAEVGNIIDPDLVTLTNENPKLRLDNKWFDAKLVLINRTIKSNPNRSFVYIDDATSAAIINPDHPQVCGVNVAEEIQSEMWRSIRGDDEFRKLVVADKPEQEKLIKKMIAEKHQS